MRTVLVGIILGALLFASPAIAQDQEKRTTITGWSPYTFGTDVATALQVNSTLKKSCIVSGQRTREPAGWLCVQGSVDAPIGGQTYRATLFLEFIQDRLEMVVVMWTFDAPMSRATARGALESELRGNYAVELRRESKNAPLELRQWLGTLLSRRLEDTPVYVIPWQDADGNVLIIVDAWGQPTLMLMYASAKAVGITPPALPPAKY